MRRFPLRSILLFRPLLAAFAASAGAAMAGSVTSQDVAEVLPQLKTLAESALKDTGVPGMAIAIVHDDKVVWVQGFGVCKVGEPAKVDGDTIFQLASVSKPITSTMIARLVGEGKLHWDDTVVKFDRDFRLKDDCVTKALTFRDLLSHRSGLPDHAGDALEDLGFDRASILRRLRSFDLGNRFRAEYAYTNYGITEAAVAAALTTGKTWEDLIVEQLFQPLGMTRTSPRFSDFQKATNRAYGHVPDNAKMVADGKWVPKYVRDPDAQSPAGGVSSSANDMARWMRLQLAEGKFDGKELIQARALEETHRPQMLTSYDGQTGNAGFYGLCWIVASDDGGHVFWKHSGEFLLGARSVVSLCPAENLGIVVLVNAAPNGLPEAMELSFYDLIFRKKLTHDWVAFANGKFQEMTNQELAGDGTDYAAVSRDAKAALPLSAYEGEYRNEVFGPLKIEARDGNLVLTIGPNATTLPLHHYSGNVFYCETTGEMMSGTSGVIFGDVKDGKAGAVTVNFLNKWGFGVFRR